MNENEVTELLEGIKADVFSLYHPSEAIKSLGEHDKELFSLLMDESIRFNQAFVVALLARLNRKP